MYSFETEQSEILEELEDTYIVDCPYCGEESIEQFNICSMPWEIDDELRVECPKCNKNFEVRSKYKFNGFYIYTDDEQMEE